MTTYRAIGKYAVDASDDEKRRACEAALREAAIELACLGQPLEAIESALDEALLAADDEIAAIAASGAGEGA